MQAEDKASLFLRESGFCILSRNRKFHGVEIDILAKANTQGFMKYYFIEVKQMQKKHFQKGVSPFGYRQWKRYLHAIEQWISDSGKMQNYTIGLLVLDEKLNILDFIATLEFEN